MPSTTSIRQIVKDLNDRKSEIARKFDKCSRDSNCRATILPAMQTWNPATEPLPAVVVQALDLTPAEVAHIEEWPQKDLVRQEAVNAIQGSLQIEFFWDLLDEPKATTSDTQFLGTGTQNDPRKVYFLTPRTKVTKSGITYGEIQLGI